MELNPFEIKSEILRIMDKYSLQSDVREFLADDFAMLDKGDPNIISKLLFKELINTKSGSEKIIKFLLERYTEKEELIAKLWEILKSNLASSEVKIIVLGFLRELETDWKYEDYSSALGDSIDIIDEDTRQMLDSAIINPEVQIDFLDFLHAVDAKDKMLLIKSLAEDYEKDALANILIPVFLSQPDSDIGKEALNILGNSKSQLAYHALNTSLEFVEESLKPLIKKNISILKLSGIREDNSKEFYKQILSESKPYRCCVTYPDGHGNQAIIFSRTNNIKRVQFAAVVVNDYNGIRDCFGFNDISQFECDKIIERFYKGEDALNITAKDVKTLLLYYEKLSKVKSNNWLLPYEYVCWKNLLADIDYENGNFEILLSKYFTRETLTQKEINEVFSEKFMNHWFLDSTYSSEFEEFLENLNLEVKNNLKNVDFDKIVEENTDKIFDKKEKNIWAKRILVCAYLKMLDKKDKITEFLCTIYKSEENFADLLKNILRKSIYEYYFMLKYNTEENQDKFTIAELDEIIAAIENRWVQNV